MAERDLLWGMVHPDDVGRLQSEDHSANRARSQFRSEVRIQTPSGQTRWIELMSMPSTEEFDGQPIWSGVTLDITQRETAEEERDRLINELRNALAEVKRLSGMLPICAW